MLHNIQIKDEQSDAHQALDHPIMPRRAFPLGLGDRWSFVQENVPIKSRITMKAYVVFFALLTLCSIANFLQGQEAGYGPGDKVFLSGSATVDVLLATVEEIVSPQYGALSNVEGTLKYLPGNSSQMEDSFQLYGENSDGLPISISGHCKAGQLIVSFSFEASFTQGVVRVEGSSLGTPSNTVLTSDGSGVATICAPQGVYATVVSGVFSRATFSATFWGDWYTWFHSVGNSLFPGSATNNSNEGVLIWSDLTGYYYLQPGETSASGDCVDYIYNDALDVWYKVPGITVGHVDIGSDGVPETPATGVANPFNGNPIYIPATDLPPVPQGGWVPPNAFPIPVPHVCQTIDW